MRDLVVAARTRHTLADGLCAECNLPWPCLTVELVEELDSIPHRVSAAVRSARVGRAAAEWQWPRCHRRNCHSDHGDIDFVFAMFSDQINEAIHVELLCRAITEPDAGEGD